MTTINDELDLLQSSVVRSAIKLERETRHDTLDSLMPWVRHADGEYPCNLGYDEGTLLAGRWICTCGLEAVLKALRDDA